jgi:hypothetical protein
MPELRGLPGVKGSLVCQHVASIDQAIRRMSGKRRAVTVAGPDGAINVWRDDGRRLRSGFCRYRAVVNEAEHKDMDSLRAWLNAWWPKMRRDEASSVDAVDPQGERVTE